jgi:hypothetical protein
MFFYSLLFGEQEKKRIKKHVFLGIKKRREYKTRFLGDQEKKRIKKHVFLGIKKKKRIKPLR